MSQSHQLAAIVFMDLEGFTSIMGENEDNAIQILNQFKEIASPLVDRYNGKWHKDLGDGALCSFGSALNAVQSATEIQQQLNSKLGVKARIGIHLGDVSFQQDDIIGDGVNVASRIQSEAAPGGICISEPVFRAIKNKKDITATFLGNRKLKNVSEKLKLFQLTSPGLETKRNDSGSSIAVWKSMSITIVVAAMTGLATYYLSRAEEGELPRAERYDIILPEENPMAFVGSAHLGAGQRALSISPDGEHLVYAANSEETTRLFIRSMETGEVRILEGTEGAYYPFFSPNGEWVAFFSNGYLKKIPKENGKPVQLCKVNNPYGATWMQDDRIIIADDEARMLNWVSSDGGGVYQVNVDCKFCYQYNYPSPLGNEHIMFSDYLYNGLGIVAVSLLTGQMTKILDFGTNPNYLPNGYLTFVDAGRLLAVPFDLQSMEVTGKVVSVIDDLRTELPGGQFTFSQKGDLIYAPGISSTKSQIVMISSNGEENPLPIKSDEYGSFRIADDGTKLLINNLYDQGLYLYDLANSSLTQISGARNVRGAIWGPGNNYITYSTGQEILQLNLYGTNKPIQIIKDSAIFYVEEISPDQKTLLYSKESQQTGKLLFHDLSGSEPDLQVEPDQGSQTLASFAPNGDFFAYTSSETEQYEVYVQPFPPDGKKWTISSGGGEEPLWSSDGSKIYYRYGEDWFETTITTNPEFIVSNRRVLFSGPYVNPPGYSYDVMPDGQNFLVLKPVTTKQNTTRLKVVKNWFGEIRRTIPKEGN